LPIEQPTKFDLVVNLRTVKALGVQVPDKMLAIADEVVEEASRFRGTGRRRWLRVESARIQGSC
jgi:hypothetical protein